MKKRILLMLLAILLATSLVCCNDNAANTGATDSDSANTDTPTGTDTAVADIPDDGIPRALVYRCVSMTNYSQGEMTTGERYGYNKSGQLIYKRLDDETETFYEIEYDANGDIVCVTDKSGTYSKRVTTFENGRCVRDERIYGDNVAEHKEYKYDENGNLILYEEYDKHKLTDSKEYTYDAENRISYHIEKSIGSAGTYYTVWEYEYEYNENGVLTAVSELLYRDDDPENIIRTVRTEYEYDETGRCVAEYEITNGADSQKRFDYTYDADGRLLTETSYHSNDVYSYAVITTFAYNERGDVLSEKTQTVACRIDDPDTVIGDDVTYSLECTYADDGRLLTKKEIDDYGHTVCEYTYSDDGYTEMRTEYAQIDTGFSEYEESMTFESVYDAEGNLLLSVYYYNGEEQSRTEYTYREFYLTEEEIALLEEADGLIEEIGHFDDPMYGDIG